MEERYCVNCRAELPGGASACPQCGTYAGDVFDGQVPKPKRRGGAWVVLILVAAGALAALRPWRYLKTQAAAEKPSTRVVSVRPGGARRAPNAKLSEPEAMLTLRRHLTSDSVRADCLVISSQGWRETSYRLTALDRCAGTRLGRFRVDVKSGEVTNEP
jgi:hypothetical protein